MFHFNVYFLHQKIAFITKYIPQDRSKLSLVMLAQARTMTRKITKILVNQDEDTNGKVVVLRTGKSMVRSTEETSVATGLSFTPARSYWPTGIVRFLTHSLSNGLQGNGRFVMAILSSRAGSCTMSARMLWSAFSFTFLPRSAPCSRQSASWWSQSSYATIFRKALRTFDLRQHNSMQIRDDEPEAFIGSIWAYACTRWYFRMMDAKIRKWLSRRRPRWHVSSSRLLKKVYSREIWTHPNVAGATRPTAAMHSYVL